MVHFLKTYPLSSLCIVCIWVLCLVPIPETPLDQVSMIDKWTHLVMYGSLCFLLCAEYGFRHRTIKWHRFILYIFICPVVMGGLIEIAQATCTGGNRSGDTADFLADAVGVILGCVIGIPLAQFLSRGRKDG